MGNDDEARWGTKEESDNSIQPNNNLEKLRSRLQWAQESQALAVRILALVNQQRSGMDAIRNLLRIMTEFNGFEAVAIRLREGDDFPYFVTNGFPGDFGEAENSPCDRDEGGEIIRDSAGHRVLECMCGNILPLTTDARCFKSFATCLTKDERSYHRGRL